MGDWNWEDNIRLAIGVCINSPQMDKPLMWSLMNLVKPKEWIVIQGGQHIKSASLNDIVNRAADDSCNKVLFLDADMDFPRTTIPQLLSHDVPIVSGLYHIKTWPFSPIAGWNKQEELAGGGTAMGRVNGAGKAWKTSYHPFPPDQLVEVDWVGIGCLMVDMEVFNKIHFPCFYDEWDHEVGCRKLGHDIIFCDAVKAAGYKIYLDTSVDCGHRTTQTVDKCYADAMNQSNFKDVYTKAVVETTKLRSYWDGKLALYHSDGNDRHQHELEKYITSKVPTGASVADLGAFTGRMLGVLKNQRNAQVMGYDISGYAVAKMRMSGIPAQQLDLRYYNPNGDKYHTVVCSHVLEHMDDEFEDHLVSVAAQMAEEQAFFCVPMDKSWWPEHVRTYSPEVLTPLLKRHFAKVEMAELDKHNPRAVSPFDLVAWCREPIKSAQSDEVQAAATG